MGVIKKQSIYGTVYTYFGALIGFVITSILFTRILEKNQIGLLNILIAYAGIYGQLGSLGINSMITRMFSYFRTPNDNRHNGFLFIAFVITLFGMTLSLILFFLTKSFIINENSSPLLKSYYLYIIPLIIFPNLFFKLFDSYSKVLYKASRGVFLNEVLPRLSVLVIIILYYFNIINFDRFVALYVISYCLPALVLLIQLKIENQFVLKPDFKLLNKKMILTIASVSLFGIIISATGEITLRIDRIMIEKLIDLQHVGVYSVAFFFGTMVILPARSVIKISSAVVADAWKDNDIDKINVVYKKSSITQFIVGAFIFILIWINIDNIVIIMTKDFSEGKFVILFIGLAYLAEMSTGVSNIILANSSKYKIQAYLLVLMAILIVFTNLLFIPVYGIVGAAFASFLSKILVLFLRWLYLWKKFKLQPYTIKTVVAVLIFATVFCIGWIIPKLNNFIIDIIIRSSVTALIFGVLVYYFKVSEDINTSIDNVFKKIGIKKQD